MSIEMDNPKTIMQLIDASANLVAQIRLAEATGDRMHLRACVEKATDFLATALGIAEEMGLE